VCLLARKQPVTISSIMSEHADKARTVSCPICRKPVSEKFRPFCSKRCADVDLNRWLSGAYVVAGKEDEDEDGARNDGEAS
jgi:endogenous inhibitor of DNA gyrase (YacG/DUF329 family)